MSTKTLLGLDFGGADMTAVIQARQRGKSRMMEMAAMINTRVNTDEWTIELRGLRYECWMVKRAVSVQAQSPAHQGMGIQWIEKYVWNVFIRVPKEHPLTMRYNVARVEGAQKRRERVEKKLQSFRPTHSVTVVRDRLRPGVLNVSLGSEDDKVRAALVAADFADKLAGVHN